MTRGELLPVNVAFRGIVPCPQVSGVVIGTQGSIGRTWYSWESDAMPHVGHHHSRQDH
jgi:hypothetical protein